MPIPLTDERKQLMAQFHKLNSEKVLHKVDYDVALACVQAIGWDDDHYKDMKVAAAEMCKLDEQLDLLQHQLTDLTAIERQQLGTIAAQQFAQQQQEAALQQQVQARMQLPPQPPQPPPQPPQPPPQPPQPPPAQPPQVPQLPQQPVTHPTPAEILAGEPMPPKIDSGKARPQHKSKTKHKRKKK